jgi:hypothetical protein
MGTQEETMTYRIDYPDYQEAFEYHGNTAIEHTCMQDGAVQRDWILFDSIEEAATYFHEQCA